MWPEGVIDEFHPLQDMPARYARDIALPVWQVLRFQLLDDVSFQKSSKPA
jgi:hypothetical protein